MPSFRLRRSDGSGSNVGGSHTLIGDDSQIAGDSVAEATGTGDLSSAIRLAGDGSAIATGTGDLATAITLRGDGAADALGTGTLTDYITPTPVQHSWREYEQYLRGPMSGVVYRFGSVKAYRGGNWHTQNIAAFSEPQDNSANDFGIQEGGGFTVDLVTSSDVVVDLAGVGAALRNQECELELVTRFRAVDGTVVQETTHVRRAIVKRSVQKRGVLTLTLKDIDRAALEKVFPFETFTVEDWPELFTDHVGRRVPQGVGTVRVPLTYIKKTGGLFRYAGPKILGAPGALLAVYRGLQEGKGAVVSASEYSVGTLTGAVSPGLAVATVDFVKDQNDFNNRPSVLEADYLLPGSRIPADEIARILALYGIATDAPSFMAARDYDAAAGFAVDCLHGGDANGRTGNAIVEDLCAVARAWLTQTPTGPWAMTQDRPGIPILEVNTAANQFEIDEYGDAEIEKTITVYYGPRLSNTEDFEGKKVEGTTSGSSGELAIKNRYVRYASVADRLRSYHQKRRNSLRTAVASIFAVQMKTADIITVNDTVIFTGKRHFTIDRLSRPADRNRATLREYDGTIHDYTPQALPAGASNVYGPDYTFTPPLAPTGLTIVSQGTSADTDGKVTSYALIRVTPPALNWSRLVIVVTDTTTNEIYQLQPMLVSGNYEVVFSGLRPNRAHNAYALAYNANGIEGISTAPPVTFTSANYTTAPSAPTGVVATQTLSFEVDVAFTKVADVAGAPKVRHYVPFVKIGAAAFTAADPILAPPYTFKVSHGVAYQVKFQTVDMNANPSVDSGVASITPVAKTDDNHVVPQGISGPSIADASINRGRGYTGTGGVSVSVGSNSSQGIDMDVYSFFPNIDHGAAAGYTVMTSAGTKAGAVDQGRFRLRETLAAGAINVSVDWRKFNA